MQTEWEIKVTMYGSSTTGSQREHNGNTTPWYFANVKKGWSQKR